MKQPGANNEQRNKVVGQSSEKEVTKDWGCDCKQEDDQKTEGNSMKYDYKHYGGTKKE